MTEAIARGDTRIGDELARDWDHDGHAPESQLDVAVEAAEFAARALRSHSRNGLMAACDPEDLGARLRPDQVTAVVAIVRMLEGVPQQPQLMP